MSITTKKCARGWSVAAFIFFLSIAGFGQNLEIKIGILSVENSLLKIEGKFSDQAEQKNWSFLQNYADAENLHLRIERINFYDAQNREIAHRQIAGGAYLTEKPAAAFSYEIKIQVPKNNLTTAHISWLSGEKGILRLNDLLPVFDENFSAQILFDELPSDWKISSGEKRLENNLFFSDRPENAVFVIGKGWKDQIFKVSRSTVKLAIDDRWEILGSDAEKITGDILSEYEKTFGAIPSENLHLILMRFPGNAGFERWRAQTFGGNVLIMSAPTTFQSQNRQRLQEQLRHELFHLWMPVNLDLSGDYAWFYEGFAQYTALRTGVRLNQITFSDFLETLGQAYNLGNRRSQPISLLDASKIRWFNEDSSVYAKGLAVAFLCDVALLKNSRGRRGLSDVLKRIYDKHKFPNKTRDGNAAILEIFKDYEELLPVVEKYIEGAEKLNFEIGLNQTGIEIRSAGNGIKLNVKSKPGGREKDLLDKLGYNNWRKFLNK